MPKAPKQSLLSRAATARLADRVLEEARVSIGEHRAAPARYIAPLDYDPNDPFALDEWLRSQSAGVDLAAHTRHRRTAPAEKIFSAPPGSVWRRMLDRRRAAQTLQSVELEARTTLSTTPTDRQASRPQSELESSGPQIAAGGGQESGIESGLHAIAEAYDGESRCSSPSATSSVLDFTMQHDPENMPGSRSTMQPRHSCQQ
jgi:hypothetical protein